MDQFKYDVAFSFMGSDEALARQLNDRLIGRMETFIYSDEQRQARLAGRDGEEMFARTFGVEARTVVVLYRAGWGEQGFTAAEESAIRNRAFEHGYDFVTFIPLDVPPTVPKWLPRNRLWVGPDRWGHEAAAAVIESRVLEQGGSPGIENALSVAKRLQLKREAQARRLALLHQGDVTETLRTAFDGLADAVQTIASEVGLECRRDKELVVIAGDWRASLGLHQEYGNSLEGAFVWVIHSRARQGRQHRYRIDADEDGLQLGWREQQAPADETGRVVVLRAADSSFVPTPLLADKIIRTLLEQLMPA